MLDYKATNIRQSVGFKPTSESLKFISIFELLQHYFSATSNILKIFDALNVITDTRIIKRTGKAFFGFIKLNKTINLSETCDELVRKGKLSLYFVQLITVFFTLNPRKVSQLSNV